MPKQTTPTQEDPADKRYYVAGAGITEFKLTSRGELELKMNVVAKDMHKDMPAIVASIAAGAVHEGLADWLDEAICKGQIKLKQMEKAEFEKNEREASGDGSEE